MSPHQLLERFDGIARGVQLTAFGLTRNDLAAATNRGEIVRVRRGVFATRSALPFAVKAAEHGGALTCAAALEHRGIWVLTHDDQPHVWVGATGRVHEHARCDCVVHYRRGSMTLGIADIADALVHSYGCHGAEFFFCAFESAWRQRKIGAYDRARIRDALPKTAQWLVDFARNDADSGLESLLRLRLHLLGITVKTQVVIPNVGRVDFVIDRLIIEADGRENHADEMRHKDLVRDARASELGYETLRFDYRLILSNWNWVRDAILGALKRLD